tara:strand:+ start:438 stop:1175 length:738 start_codon:yes stop_codon:yes gene_type:complete
MHLVSVIMPYFRKKEFVEQSILSVMNQSFKNIELIIIYDDENFEDYEYISKICKNYKNIKIIKNKKNLGAGESRNVGIKSSKGDLIAFIDADDYWYKNKLEKQIKFMDENSYQFIFCDYIIKSKNGEKIISYKNKFLDYSILLKSCDIGLSTVIISSDLIKENLFPKLITKEDYVVWLQITKKKINAYCLNETLVIWNKTHNSLSSNILQKIFDGYKVYRFYEKFNFIKSLFFLIILSFNSLKKK